MYIEEYIGKILPNRCGVSEVFGKIAVRNFRQEMAGEELFSLANFKNHRERCMLGMPYAPAPGREAEYKHGLDVLEAISLRHYQTKHGEDLEKEIHRLLSLGELNKEDAKALEPDWWN